MHGMHSVAGNFSARYYINSSFSCTQDKGYRPIWQLKTVSFAVLHAILRFGDRFHGEFTAQNKHCAIHRCPAIPQVGCGIFCCRMIASSEPDCPARVYIGLYIALYIVLYIGVDQG